MASKKFKLNFTFKTFIGLVLLFTFLFGAAVLSVIDSKVTSKLDGVLWTIPAKIYSRSLEIAEGGLVNKKNLLRELEMLSYQKVRKATDLGEYYYNGKNLNIFLRGHLKQSSGLYRITFEEERVKSIENQGGSVVNSIILEPMAIGGMYPSHMEDRVLLDWPQIPDKLVKILLSVEDQGFFNHYGISLKSISRAFFRNIQAANIEQGGSTITQQLAKNLFFSSEQTLKRKVSEAIAALLIEFHYTKKEILLAYINDVYLAQSGTRSIHGFGLGSKHFFGASLRNLEDHQLALLVGMLKGPSVYNPRRNPNNALKRRNVVLRVMERDGIISTQILENQVKEEIKIVKPNYSSETKYPAFHDLVRIELRNNFNENELRTEGLSVSTNIDPVLQESLEKNIVLTKKQLIKKYGSKLNKLEGAAIVIDIQSGEVRALVGSTSPRQFGFNRSLNAVRSIGSLVKPFVYLTALNKYQDYNLVTILDDSKLSVPLSKNSSWEPNNFDKKFHGNVPLHKALWQSYNIASARLGLEVGFENVKETFKLLGIDKNVPHYPSLFIGSFEMSPYEVAQAYQSIASDGFYTPLRSIREISDAKGNVNLRYPYKIEQRFRPEPVSLLKFAMRQTFLEGTARGYSLNKIDKWMVGGKTGTSDDQRDSWFAGYAGDYLVLVWLGFDDNRSTPLTGRSGALQVWKNFIDDINPSRVNKAILPRIHYVWTDINDGTLSGPKCKGSILTPFIKGTEPKPVPSRKNCGPAFEETSNTVLNRLKSVLLKD
jgi:penicillin-binding protein 1B